MENFVTGLKGKAPTSKKAADTQDKNKFLPWIEKYRPKTVDEIAHQEEVVSVLKKCIQGSDLPNLLLYGPPGTGKTSAILAAARQLFGEHFRDRVLELNASDERGIQVVREKVKNFAQLACSAQLQGRPCPALRLVILDEADSMTSAAQAALRRTMETESKQTRFCLICNYVSRIIAPLTSRCAKFRFKPLSGDAQIQRLRMICEKEKVDISDSGLLAVQKMSGGDLRKAITCLQSAAQMKPGEDIAETDIEELAGQIPDDWISRLFRAAATGSYESLQDFMLNFLREGYGADQFLEQILEEVLNHPEMQDMHKANICDKIGSVEAKLLDGADEFLQLMDLGCVIMKQ